MRIPGFEAEASLYRSTTFYRSSSGAGLSRRLVPQLMAGGGAGVQGGVLTDIECALRYLNCVVVCGVEWVGWAGVNVGVANGLFSYCESNCEVGGLRCLLGLPSEPGIP